MGMKDEKRRPLILALTPLEETPPPAADISVLATASPGEAAASGSPPPTVTRAERGRRARAERAAARAPSQAVEATPEASAEAAPVLARWAYPVAAFTALIWIGALAAFVAGYERRAWAFDYAPFRLAIAAALALLPALFMLLFAYALRQAARLASEARRARSLSDDLSTPAMLAAAGAGGAAQAVREEVGRVKAVADEAARRMAELRRALADESRLLTEAAATAERSARTLGGRLQSERAELGGLSSALDAQTTAAVEGLARQSRLVADVSDLAQAQLAEAEAALTTRTADLLAAANGAERAAAGAGEELNRQNGRLEHLAQQLAHERDGLAAAGESLFATQDDLLARAESQNARLTTAAGKARDDARSLIEASASGAESLKDLIGEAAIQARTLVDAARREQSGLSERARTDLAALAGDAAAARETIETETRAALDRLRAAADAARDAAQASAAALTAHAEAAGRGARTHVDDLAQAAFDIGQKADQAFDTRLAAARRAIDAQAALVEEAGLRAGARIEAGVEAARTTLDQMEGLVAELEGRLAKAPDDARTWVEGLRSAVEAGMEGISAAARRAAAETEAVDHAFQNRVRVTYETLSDAMRSVPPADVIEAPAAPKPQTAPAPTPAAASTAAPARAWEDEDLFPGREPRPQPAPNPLANEPLRAVANGSAFAAPPPEPAPAALRPAALAERPALDPPAPPLRTRLRLAPTAEDAEVRALFAPLVAADAPAASDPITLRDDDWSWKDLLGGMDQQGPVDDEALAEQLLGEIAAMGVDPAALLPRARIDEIARTVHAGDVGQAREAVRRLAPAAVRRLSRRVMTDRVLRGQADLYRRRYGDLIHEASRGDVEGAAVEALLGSEPGRAYLLLEAAAGDLH